MQQSLNRRDAYGAAGMKAAVGGREVEVSSVRVDRSMPDPLASEKLTAAEARFTAVEGPDVVESVATPWDPGTSWPPVPQTAASVSMDTGAGPVSLLGNGRVVSASGGSSGREVSVEVSDAYQSLNRTISWDGVADIMPSQQEGVNPRYVGMTSTAVTDVILRECGWYSTPPRTNYAMLSVPAQGSMWPERGYVDTSNRMDSGGYPYWLPADWGVAAADVDASYTLQGGGYTIAGRGGVELSAMTQTSSAAQPGTMYLDVYAGSARVRMSWTDSDVFVRFRDPGSASYFTAVTVPRSNGLAYASIKYVSATSVLVTLRSGGAQAAQAVTVDAGLTSGAMTTARISGQGRGGGFMVAAPDTQGTLTGWTPNAVLYPRTSNRNALRVRPPIEGGNCADLLAQQCEAEGAAYWIDETGVLRWWDLARLEAQSSVATLGSDDDIAESGFAWSHDLSQVKSRVSVKWREPLAEMSWRTSIELHRGNGQTLQPDDVLEDWINVPDDEVWIMPDLNLDRAGGAGASELNNGLMSHYGAVIAGEGDDVDSWAQSHGSLLMTVTRVNDRAFKTWIQWTGSKPASMKLPSEKATSFLWQVRRNENMPIIRGKAKWTLQDALTYSAQSGPSTAPEHEIDAGWWIQSEAQAQYTADYAGARLTVPQPVLSSVALIPIPGLQVGDVVEVRDEHVTRLTIRGIVIEDSRSINTDMDMSHAVSIRPTYVTRNGVTWEEWGQAASVTGAGTYQSWGSRQAGNTYQQWGANPLLGEAVL